MDIGILIIISLAVTAAVKVPEAVNEVTFAAAVDAGLTVLTGPIIPPLAIADYPYASLITSYDTIKSRSPVAAVPPLRISPSIKYIGVSNTTSVASAGTEIVFAK